jgi:hypothetical protein
VLRGAAIAILPLGAQVVASEERAALIIDGIIGDVVDENLDTLLRLLPAVFEAADAPCHAAGLQLARAIFGATAPTMPRNMICRFSYCVLAHKDDSCLFSSAKDLYCHLSLAARSYVLH